MKKVVLASNNKGKIAEFRALLADYPIELIPQGELGVSEVEETGLSFVENAIIKARHAANETGLPALSDDSGLAVAALKGEPGIYSARYAGADGDAIKNMQQLLTAMKAVPDENRQACFHCILVFMTHALDPTPLICEGIWHGQILHAIQGDKGFGYDPVFYVPALAKTAAELDRDVKNKLSHRGQAMQLLRTKMADKS